MQITKQLLRGTNYNRVMKLVRAQYGRPVHRRNKNTMTPLRVSPLHHPNSAITLAHNFTSYPNAFTCSSIPTPCRVYPFQLYDRKTHRHPKIRALREWQEYEQAVKDKDLSRALRFLRDIPIEPKDSSIDPSRSPGGGGELDWFRLERDWEVLDTCLNADDMRLVGSAYAFLKDKGLLPNFGKYRSIVLEGPRDVTPTVLKSSTGLDVQ